MTAQEGGNTSETVWKQIMMVSSSLSSLGAFQRSYSGSTATLVTFYLSTT